MIARSAIASSLLAAGAAVATAVSAAGCISVPEGPAPMCHTNNDCDRAHGEVCEDAVCWGNPPPGPFAAVVLPPSSRRDLVSREIPQVIIPDFGWMGDLSLEAPVQLNGRVVAFCPSTAMNCPNTPLAATITVTRRSQFQGGPGFQAIVNAVAGADSFSMSLPHTAMGDDPYVVTIAPDDGPQPGSRPAPATLVPPLRIELSVADNISAKPFTLGAADLPVISGQLTDSLGAGLSGYRVAAVGRWDPTESPIEVSTIATTDGMGNYAVTLSANLVGTVEIVAHPPTGLVAPTIHLAGLDATVSASGASAVAPATFGNPVAPSVKIVGTDLSGTISPVPGAQVTVSSSLTTRTGTFVMADQQTTDGNGSVVLHLLDGAGFAGSYTLSVIPPASSTLGVVFEQPLALPAGPLTKQLTARIALRGKIVNASGKPLGNATVTARPSLRFLWALDTDPQAFVAAIPTATTVTNDNGEYVVWVDPNIGTSPTATTWGYYDLVIEPAAMDQAPAFIQSDVMIPRTGMDTVSLDKLTLPSPAFVHGRITGPDGSTVNGAELKLYLVSTALNLCSEVAHAPTSCPIPAQLLGRNTSDSAGTVELALPR